MNYIYPNVPNWLDPSEVSQFDRKPEWIAERKKNGWRCLAVRNSTALELWTRRHSLIPDELPKTRAALSMLKPDTIIDGELLDKRTKDTKDHYYAFDIIYNEGKLLASMPWILRRKILEEVLQDIPDIEISIPVTLGKSHLYQVAIEEGDEGIVLKNTDSKYLIDYQSCPSNPYWIKAKQPEKCFKTQEGV
ncbi:MAG: hypothetical protein EHM36_00725 [Deltaproteobacteria bacterium]|nr:MAG: hypothetical protein EHM36_00725 [Deltaproteobacteria bacterium]